MRTRVLAVVLLSLVPAACGGSSSSTPSSGTTTTAAPREQMTATAYFLRDGRVAPAHARVERTNAVAHAALEALFAGPPEGLASEIPKAVGSFDLAIHEGTAELSFATAGDLTAPARAQIVYTLTQFRTIERVRIGDAPAARRADYEDQTPIILVETPAPGDAVTSPIHVAGTANTFEATLQLRVVQDGKKLYEHFVTATSGSGQRGTFAWDIPVDAKGPATLVAFEYSAKDGSEIHKVEIPITLE